MKYLILALLTISAHADPYCYGDPYCGPKLYSEGGKYIGRLNNNPYDPESVSNPAGAYGNRYDPESVYNPYGSNYIKGIDDEEQSRRGVSGNFEK